MRWKLACGGVVGTTKQPVRNREFDKLVVEYISINTLDITGCSIKLYNPSTHTIRKCHNREIYISITPVSRYCGQAYFVHLPHNYYKLETDLHYGLNNISDSFDASDFWRDGIRGYYRVPGRAFGKKSTVDRLRYPENYSNYFELSNNDQVVTHYPNPKWLNELNDQVRIVLWKGPCRKHGERQLTNTVTIDVEKDYLIEENEE